MVIKTKNISKTLIVTASAFIIIAGIKASAIIVIPVLLSILIAVLCSGPMFWLQKHGVSKTFAIIIVTLTILIIGSFLVSFIASSITDLTRALPSYQAKLNVELKSVTHKLEGYGIDTSSFMKINTNSIVHFIRKALSSLGGLLSNALLIVITVIFMLFEAAGFPHKLKIAFGVQDDLPATNMTKIAQGIKRYLALKFFTSLATGILIFIWVFFLNIDFPLLWGLLAFLLNFVPTIGSIIASIPAIILAFIDSGLFLCIITGVGYFIINIFISNIIEPRIMGQGVGLSALVVFVSLLFWGWVLGPVGMLLSVPLTMTVKIALESNESTKWVAVLLGPDIKKPE
jgi:predicted PurR-regulated permease PerM